MQHIGRTTIRMYIPVYRENLVPGISEYSFNFNCTLIGEQSPGKSAESPLRYDRKSEMFAPRNFLIEFEHILCKIPCNICFIRSHHFSSDRSFHSGIDDMELFD